MPQLVSEITTMTDTIIVTAQQMQAIENMIFTRGMPVAALMEKAAGLIVQYLREHYPKSDYSSVGLIVGSGHNGGDALVVARELYFSGYQVQIYKALAQSKDLTQNHLDYALFLGIKQADEIEALLQCDLLIDGLFGFGLERHISGELAHLIQTVNQAQKIVVSIDLPSGIHTDTGAVLGTAIKATESLCLGLWKRAYFQDQAIPYLGKITRLNFGIPEQSLAIAPMEPRLQLFTETLAQSYLPLRRSPLTHKYQQGHTLLIGGSQTYAGSILLAALGARATGVGMLTIVVPESLKTMVVAQLPEALVIGCPETATGAIQILPNLDWTRYQAIACGCGLTLEGATHILPSLITQKIPLILDADALNALANDALNKSTLTWLQQRQNVTECPTILTPHLGEFKRLFPGVRQTGDRLTMNQQAAQLSRAIILLKGAKSIITQPNGSSYCLQASTPALARGGSGDVLLGLLGGLLAQNPHHGFDVTATAAWWHAQAGILAAQERTLAGVDGVTLSSYLSRFLTNFA